MLDANEAIPSETYRFKRKMQIAEHKIYPKEKWNQLIFLVNYQLQIFF